MASESNSQPSSSPPPPSPTIHSSDYHNEISTQISHKVKRRDIFHRLFGKLHVTPFIYTDELKPYSVNGCNVNNNGRTVITKK